MEGHYNAIRQINRPTIAQINSKGTLSLRALTSSKAGTDWTSYVIISLEAIARRVTREFRSLALSKNDFSALLFSFAFLCSSHIYIYRRCSLMVELCTSGTCTLICYEPNFHRYVFSTFYKIFFWKAFVIHKTIFFYVINKLI